MEPITTQEQLDGILDQVEKDWENSTMSMIAAGHVSESLEEVANACTTADLRTTVDNFAADFALECEALFSILGGG